MHFLVIFTISDMVLLNSDILLIIFDYLTCHEVSEMRIVCSLWKNIGEQNLRHANYLGSVYENHK